MAKQTRKKVTLADFEARARQFISLSFAFCEEELQRERRPHQHPTPKRSTAQAAATLSVHESIQTLLAVARIERE